MGHWPLGLGIGVRLQRTVHYRPICYGAVCYGIVGYGAIGFSYRVGYRIIHHGHVHALGALRLGNMANGNIHRLPQA